LFGRVSDALVQNIASAVLFKPDRPLDYSPIEPWRQQTPRVLSERSFAAIRPRR
jgi:hypothetical protein